MHYLRLQYAPFPATTALCNAADFLQEGEVAEQGTHAELLAHQGIYADMWSQQELGAKAESTNSSERSSSAEEENQQGS